MATGSLQRFGDLLRNYRRAAGMTQEELAAEAGLSTRGLSDLERGARLAPRKETVQLLCEALHLSEAERTLLETAARQRETQGNALAAVPAHKLPMWSLVGRERELALLQQVLAEGPPLLLIAGEAGIGKSRLLYAGIEQAEDMGWTVLTGSCHRRSGQESYAPLVGALIDFVYRQTPAQQRLQLQGCSWLVRLLPELAESEVVAHPGWNLPSEQERRLMFGAVARYLANVAGTLLVLDDLHWAGIDTFDLLQALIQAPRERPLRILGAYRDTDIKRQGPLALFLSDLTREGYVQRELLAPLSEAASKAFLDELLPATAHEEPRLRQKVLERSGGVPLFLVSCAQALSTGSLTWNGSSHIPWSLREAVLQRIIALSENAQQVLRLAAVIGQRVPRSLLATLATRSGLHEEGILEALEECERGRLLAEADSETYQLTHNLIREALLADLGLARRTLLHRRVAEALEEGTGVSSIEALAYHYARSGVVDKAVHYLEQAGDAARARYAGAEAVEMYLEVVTRLETLGRAGDIARIREKFGEVLTSLARYDQALEVLEAAATYYRQQGDQESQLRALAQLGVIHRWRGSTQEGLKRLLPLAESLARSSPTPATAHFFVSLTQLYFGIGNYHQQLAMAEQAATMARALQDDRLLLHAQGRRGAALFVLGRLEEARQVLSTDVVPPAEVLGEVLIWRQALTNLGAIATYQGYFNQARTYLEQATTLSEQLGDRPGLTSLAFQRGLLAYYLGEWQQAQRDFQQGQSLAARGALLAYPLGGLGLLNFTEGDHEAATRYWSQALALVEQHQDGRGQRWVHAMLAEKDLIAGEPERALAHLAPFVPFSVPQEGNLDVRELLPLLAWVHVDLKQPLQAQELLTSLLIDLRAASMRLALADALRVQALLAMSLDRWSESEAALTEALELARSFPSPYGEAKLLMEYGQLRARQDNQEHARQYFKEALAILARLGERQYTRTIERLLAL